MLSRGYDMSAEKDPVKTMAELLKAGAVMLAETCPVEGCTLPLFKLKTGEVICPVHGRVHIVRTEEEAREVYARVYSSMVLEKLEMLTLKTIEELSRSRDVDPTDLIKWLEVLERVQRLKTTIKK
jgi:UPF0148 protein